MPDYRRNRVPRGTFFFTVNLPDRRSNLLVARIDGLCATRVRQAAPERHSYRRLGRPSRPHAHVCGRWRKTNANFPSRWRAIQDRVCKIVARRRTAISLVRQPWRTRHLAAALLGAHDRDESRFRCPNGFHPSQPGQARFSWRTRRIGRISSFHRCAASGLYPAGLGRVAATNRNDRRTALSRRRRKRTEGHDR